MLGQAYGLAVRRLILPHSQTPRLSSGPERLLQTLAEDLFRPEGATPT